MIEIKNFSKSYKDKTIFDNFSLTIGDGVTCILGESGSGKTTLLNAILDLNEYKGEITKKTCSCIFQKDNLFPNLTVKENLLIANKNYEEVLRIAKAFNIEDKLNAYPLKLSGGEARRVAIARGLLMDAEYLLMDEPFSSLDLKTKEDVIGYFLLELEKKPRGVIFVTHDIFEAVAFSDEILVLKKGKLIYQTKNDNKKMVSGYFGNEELKKKLYEILKKS